MGGGEQRSGSGPTEPNTIRISGEDCGAGGGPGPSSTGGERGGQRPLQAPAPRTTPLLESQLLPGQNPTQHLTFNHYLFHISAVSYISPVRCWRRRSLPGSAVSPTCTRGAPGSQATCRLSNTASWLTWPQCATC